MKTLSRNFPLQIACVAFMLVALLGLLSLPKTVHAQSTTFRNPLNSTGPDPWMTYYNGNYYLMSTQWTTLKMWKAPTIAALKTASPTTVWTDYPAARCCNVWAPEFHLLNGPNGSRWYIYYSAGPSGTCCDGQRVWVLESSGTDPLGPYTFKGAMTDSNNYWGIDGSVMSLNGALYFIYSGVDALGGEQNIYIAPMSNPWTISGARVRISTPSLSWERVGSPVQEGPVALQRNGQTFIIYSASSCNTADYKLGQLTYTGTNPLSASSWTKKSTSIFQQGNGVYGPGHNGFFKSPDGTEDWIVYHANTSASGGCGSARTTRIQKFTWNADGSPNLGSPLATTTDILVPAGEVSNGPTPTSGPTAIPATYYRLTNRNSGKVADVQQPNTSNSAKIGQWAWSGVNWQQWQFVDKGGYFNIVSRHSGKCLDVTGASSADGAGIIQYTCGTGTNQQFQWVATGSYFNLKARHSGKCVNVVGSSTADGALLEQRTCGTGNSFQWTRQ